MPAQSSPEALAEAIDRLEGHLDVNASNGQWHLAPMYRSGEGYIATVFVDAAWGSLLIEPLGPGHAVGTVVSIAGVSDLPEDSGCDGGGESGDVRDRVHDGLREVCGGPPRVSASLTKVG